MTGVPIITHGDLCLVSSVMGKTLASSSSYPSLTLRGIDSLLGLSGVRPERALQEYPGHERDRETIPGLRNGGTLEKYNQVPWSGGPW